ncbi:MAG: HNH endonuclease [Anaerolineae bacterium]|nr:HNH endonuclease [Anaerolineae bacterium]
MTTTIALTQGKIARVSEEDLEYLLSIGSWCWSNTGYAVHFHRSDDGRRQTWSMHRLVMARVLGHPVPTNLVVDHVDHDRLNNTRANLRIADRSQNQANRSLNEDSTVGYKGVSPDGYKFRARIRYDRGHSLHLGEYNDPELAALVYDAATRLLNAEFGHPNFPDRPTPSAAQAILGDRLQRNPEALAYLKRLGRSLT